MRDTQKQKFYDFENEIIKRYLPENLADYLGMDESTSLVNRICAAYHVTPPKVKIGRSMRIAYFKSLRNTITLPPWAQRSNVVLHEAVHAIVWAKNLPGPSHGAAFVGLWMEIFSRMYDLPLKELQNWATLREVDFS